MDYRMLGDILSAVEIRLQAREVTYTQSGGIAWMSDGFTLDSNVEGGFIKELGRILPDESLFMATYMTSRPDSTITLAFTVPGKTLAINTTKTSPTYQKGALLCAQMTVEINTVLIKRFTTGFFGEGGFILQRTQGSDMAFLEVDGDVVEKVPVPREAIKVGMGNVLVFESGVPYEIETVKGVRNILFDGEGLFLTELMSPDKIYMQTMNIAEFTERIVQGLPVSR